MSKVNLLNRQVATAFYGRFPKLRPAQDDAISPLVEGKNVVISSGTGSGKTEAVMAPLVSRYWHQFFQEDAPILLYIAPTKALVNDLLKRLSVPANVLGLRIGVRHGDRDDLTSGPCPHILLTTPESLDVLLFRKDAALNTVKAIILDEVHLLYNTQRGLQLSVLIVRLERRLGYELQWAALSATIGELSSMKTFIFKGSEEAVLIEYPSERSIDAHIRYTSSETDFVDLIQKITRNQKIKLLIFANSRRECERLTTTLRQESGLSDQILAHFSSLSHEVRIETEQRFAALETAICVATSTLELGIDIGDIDAIILWGVPSGVESFLQRIGRGSRRTKKTNVICLVPDDSKHIVLDALYYVTLIADARIGALPNREPYHLFGAFGQQCLGMIASDNGRYTRITDLLSFFEHKEYLDRATLESILSSLADEEYLQPHGFKNQYGGDQELYKVVDYRMIYGNFGASSQEVEIRHDSRILGSVPAENLLRLKTGELVRFAGNIWTIRKASIDSIVLVPSSTMGEIKDFRYSGPGIEAESYLANRMWNLIHSDDIPDDVFADHLRQPILDMIRRFRQKIAPNHIPYFREQKGIRYLTFAGSLVNRAIAAISNLEEYEVDNLSILARSPIDWGLLPNNRDGFVDVLPQLVDQKAEKSIYQNLLPWELQQREMLQEWLKDTSVTDVLERLSESDTVIVDPNLYHQLTEPIGNQN